MQSYLVAYDICDAKLLSKVARCCEDFGTRYQFSVFFCHLSATDFVRSRSRLYDIIDLAKDQVMYVCMCAKCSATVESIGLPLDPADAKDVVVVI